MIICIAESSSHLPQPVRLDGRVELGQRQEAGLVRVQLLEGDAGARRLESERPEQDLQHPIPSI